MEILNILKTRGKALKDMRILDVGCGAGGELRNFIRYGALPENLYGIDLLPDRIELAKRLSPNINFICDDASNLPYDNESFDIVMQFTVFTSILDNDMKLKIASEMLPVLKPDGIIIWYDYFVDNPKNPDVKGIKKKEIYKLFPNCDIHLKRITLAPPIARLVAPYSYLACYLLEKLKIFNTHYLGTIKKRTKSQP
ncbi:MAG: class I SAM-dependent methyltransferase [Candidatus Anstonellales archaeon]